MLKQRISPLSKQSPPFSPTSPFLEKIFHTHPYYQICETQSTPFIKGGGEAGGVWTMYVDNNLKHEIDFIINHNELLADHTTKDKISQFHEHGKQ